MKLERLEQAALNAQEELKAVETKVTDLAMRAKAAKGQARTAKRTYKSARKLARAARKLFVRAEQQLQEQRLVLVKAQKRLAKTSKRAVTQEATLLPVLAPGAVTAKRRATARNAERRRNRSVARGAGAGGF